MVKDLSVGNPLKVLWLYSLPLIGSVVFQQMYNMADTIIAGKAIDEAAASLEAGAGSDATIACVAEARAALSSLLGLDAAEDLLDKVFGSFCVGK